jgi:hypothetical protein
MSDIRELATLVLQMLVSGEGVSEKSALQLRAWAVKHAPEYSMLPVEVIARRILREEENNQKRSA